MFACTRQVKPFWILMKQKMMGWQWHQLDHMQIICTSLQIDNHASNSSLNFLRAGCSSCLPPNNVKALTELTFYAQFDTKQAISETLPKPISLLSMEEQNLTQQKHTFTNQKKCTTKRNKHKKLKPV